jgi:hypothetical protein
VLLCQLPGWLLADLSGLGVPVWGFGKLRRGGLLSLLWLLVLLRLRLRLGDRCRRLHDEFFIEAIGRRQGTHDVAISAARIFGWIFWEAKIGKGVYQNRNATVMVPPRSASLPSAVRTSTDREFMAVSYEYGMLTGCE